MKSKERGQKQMKRGRTARLLLIECKRTREMAFSHGTPDPAADSFSGSSSSGPLHLVTSPDSSVSSWSPTRPTEI